MVQSDNKNDQIRSLIKDQSPIRTLSPILDQQGAAILIQVWLHLFAYK